MIAPAHLEGFGSIDNVAAAKGEIMEGLPPDGVFYVNADDPRCVAIAERFSGKKIVFGSRGDVVLTHCAYDTSGEMNLHIDPIGDLRLPLPSRAHVTNVLLAVAVGMRHGVTIFEEPLREAARASTRFKAVQVGPLRILDDTYNANPASVEAALQTLGEQPKGGLRIAALGEMLELGETAAHYHRAVGAQAAAHGVTHLFARGEHARDTIAGAREAGVPHVDVIEDHHTMAQAIHRVASEGDVVLVKGSRGMRMERVIDHLRELYGE